MRRLSDKLILTFAFAFVMAIATRTAAQAKPGSDPDSAYHEAIARALEEFDLGHWTEAKVFFREAHARKPSARTLRGIGLACYESRTYVEAIDYLQQALASTVQPLTPEMRSAAARLIEQSRQFVMRAQIELEPRTAELRVDGKPVRLAADGGLLLDPGEHELSVSAVGFAPLRRRVNSEGGSEQQLHLMLQPRPEAVASGELAAPKAATEPAPQRAARSIAPWVVVGGSAALAATGGVLLGIGLSDKAAVEGAEDGGTWSSQEDADARAVPLQTAGGVMLGVGLAGVAAGLAWQFWPSAEREPEPLALSVGPGGFRLRRRF